MIITANQIQHLEHERETWLRTLDYIQQENIHLKTRLAGIIKYEVDNDLLEQVEYFQNQFLNKDAVITLLRHDIATIKDIDFTTFNKKILVKHEKLRKDMELMEKEFSRLKFDFNNYLSQVL